MTATGLRGVAINGAVAAVLVGLIVSLLACTTPDRSGPPETDAAVADTAPAKGPAAPALMEPLPTKEHGAPSPAKPAPASALDLTSLEERLRETPAIGILTKIALKNEVDDLLEHFREFHEGRRETSLTELRERFNGLFLKVLSLVQDHDPGLARDIASSREAIWSFLTDPGKCATLTGGKRQ